MIGKKVRNPGKSSAVEVRVHRLADYIDQPENALPNARAANRAAKAARVDGLADYALRPLADPAREKCIYGGGRSFIATDHATCKIEMLMLAQASAHSKDPINHYVLSWQQGEQPTPAQVEEAVDLFLEAMGLTGHQALYGLHVDTDNVHLHLMVNRVHPITRKVVEINKGFDLEALHRAVARIEYRQGWRREARGRYRVQADGTVQRDRHSPLKDTDRDGQPVRSRSNRRHASGAKSAERIAAETGAPLIRTARSWLELHERLTALGLRYERTGSGAVLWVGETAVKASRAGRDCSLRAVERRLGAYRPAPAGLTVAVRLPEPDVPDAPCGSEYPAARGRYDGERCADTQAVRDRHRAEREALRTAHRSQRDALWQSAPPGGWHGRGAELNTQRSLLAARQAAEGAALRERHRRERARSRVQWGEHFPSYEDGLAAQTPGADRRQAR